MVTFFLTYNIFVLKVVGFIEWMYNEIAVRMRRMHVKRLYSFTWKSPPHFQQGFFAEDC